MLPRLKSLFINRYFTMFSQVVKANATPRKIAIALAVGIFWNFLPIVGVGAILSFLVAKILRGSALLAVTTHLGTAILIPGFYTLNYLTGRWILGGAEVDFLKPVLTLLNSMGQTLEQWLNPAVVQTAVSITYNFLVGSFLNAVLAFIVVYIVSRVIVTQVQKSKKPAIQGYLDVSG